MIQKILTTALFLTVIAPLPAFASDNDCYVPMADWKPKHDVQAMIEGNGWEVRRIKIDNGCYEVYVYNSKGENYEARVNPATLKIIKIEKENFLKLKPAKQEKKHKKKKGKEND